MRSALGAARRSLHPALVPVASASLRRQAARADGVDGAVDLVFRFGVGGLGIAPMQARSEITRLLDLLAQDPPRTVLEIGTARGGTLFLWSRVAAPDALLVSVDLPDGLFGGGYPEWKAPLYRSFARDEQRVDRVRAHTPSQETLEYVKELLGGREVDFLFVDGDHTYDGVARDYDLYSPLVRPGGVIALHDVVPQGAHPADGDEFQVGEVPQFWAELRDRAQVEELVEDWDQGRFGIGVVKV
jgi:predicted O-methyltransferase YrrM